MIRSYLCLWLAALGAFAVPMWSQEDSGVLRGVVTDAAGRAAEGMGVRAEPAPAGVTKRAETSAAGEFYFNLKYGHYLLSIGNQTQSIQIRPLQSTCVRVVSGSAVAVVPCRISAAPVWALPAWRSALPEQNSLDARLLTLEPGTTTQPLNLTGPVTTPLALISQRAFSWTSVRYEFQGADATDPYQPGRPGILIDPSSAEDVVLQSAFGAPPPSLYGATISIFGRAFAEKWRSTLASSYTGSALTAGNLPDAATRGLVTRSEHYRWFTRDRVETGGPLGRRVNVFVAVTGQWSSQTIPQAAAREDLSSRVLSGIGRLGSRLTATDHLEASFNGARTARSDWGEPAGIEALAARRGSPSWSATPNGFPGLPADDGFYNMAASWTHTGKRNGELEVRFGISDMRLHTPYAAQADQSRVDLLRGMAAGTPPVAGTGTRRTFDLAATYAPQDLRLAGSTHRLLSGAEWETGGIRNQPFSPGGLNLITAAGEPAFAVSLYTPESRSRMYDARAWVRDEFALAPWLKATLGAGLDRATGSVPGVVTAAVVTPEPVSTGGRLISWTSISRAAAVAATPGRFQRLVLRAGYSRVYAPLAGRYLDYGNPISLGGVQYRWQDANHDGLFQSGELGPAVLAFGGPYSRIDSGLKRPYADEVDVAAEAELPFGLSASLRLFRRDEKRRLAAVNTGVPESAFTRVTVLDSGPDGRVGTFDDALLNAYAQSSATLGADSYLLTNPAGLKTLGEGVIAELRGQWGAWQFHSSFMAVKSEGPTNPGNSPLQNDPGVVGALYSDPNASVNAGGRAFFDRAYVGKTQLIGVLPRFLARLEWANTVTYMDGLPFARLLLITGLPQGPFWVDASIHGSPGGGNRGEYVLNWNTRLAKRVRLSEASLRVGADVYNAARFGNRVQEIDISGPGFNQRLPVAIQPALSMRFFAQLEL